MADLVELAAPLRGRPRGAARGRKGGPPPRAALATPTRLQRNNTSYPAQVTTRLKELYESYKRARAEPAASPEHKWAVGLKYYQYLVRAVMSDPEYGIGAEGNARGLLVYHTPGMGKTRLATAVAMALWDIRPVVVMLARSLQGNFRKTVEEVVGLLSPEAGDAERAAAVARFVFISMDAYNAADQMARAGTGAKRVKRGDIAGATGGLDGKLLIVDEAHNFFRAIINSPAENANARRMYDMVMGARNLRLLFLTGTPSAKDPFELVPCFNMLAGSEILPTQYEMFYKYYVDRAGGRVLNREKLANRLVGLVSHVTHSLPSEPPGPPAGPLSREQVLLGMASPGYDVAILWGLVAGLPVETVEAPAALEYLRQFKQWGQAGHSPVDIVSDPSLDPGEYARVLGADLQWPVLLSDPSESRAFHVIDGVHRLAKALLVEKQATFRAQYVPWALLEESVRAGAAQAHAPKAARDDGWFPEVKPTIVSRVEMGPDQYRQYLLAREKEEAEGKSGEGFGPRREAVLATQPLSLPGSEKKAMRSYYVSSRSLGNFAPPREWAGSPVEAMPDDVFAASLGPKMELIAERADKAPGPVLVYSQFVDVGGLKPMGRFLERKGYARFVPGGKKAPPGVYQGAPGETFAHEGGVYDVNCALRIGATKKTEAVPVSSLRWALERAPPLERGRVERADLSAPVLIAPASNGALAVVDGIHRLQKAVETGAASLDAKVLALSELARCRAAAGVAADGGAAGAPPPRGYYAVISGGVSVEDRDQIKEVLRAPENMHGELIKVILISKSGAEGYDFRFVRETHQLEPYWDMARDDQVIGRAARLGSHDGLPRPEREVQPYLYLAVANERIWRQMMERDREARTIDEQFHERALARYKINKAFRQLLVEVSLECALFGYGACRVCVPSNAPLFHDDPALDLRLPDPCEVRRESEVRAVPLRAGDKTYYYTEDPASPFGYTFYSYREDLGGHAPIDPADPAIAELLALVGRPRASQRAR